MKPFPAFVLLLAAAAQAADPAPTVRESARQIPVVANVDVVVAGGSTGAVAAAAEAARQGARVFLAAPHPYLGDDMTATLRLTLRDGESPDSDLARRIFAPEGHATGDPAPESFPFAYTTDRPSEARHADTDPPSKLADGVWNSASATSVEYGGDVAISCDLGDSRSPTRAVLMAFHRVDYSLGSVELHTSNDGAAWSRVGAIDNAYPAQAGPDSAGIPFAFDTPNPFRYARFTVRRAPEATRVLVGEVVFEKPTGEEPGLESGAAWVRPLHVKRVLDEELLEAGVIFLYSSLVTDILRDANGALAGIVIANRAGRQAVIAPTVIDATDESVVARLAGAAWRQADGGPETCGRIVIGGEPRQGPGVRADTTTPPATFHGKRYPFIEYTLEIPGPIDSPQSLAEAEQTARDRTYHPDQQFAADVLFRVPAQRLKSANPFSGPAMETPAAACLPDTSPNLFVLGPRADVDRQTAEELTHPCTLIRLGLRIGSRAAADRRTPVGPVKVAGIAPSPADAGADSDTREILDGARPGRAYDVVEAPATGIPVLGEWDVVVVGGGTSGAPAAIGAARRGARTLLAEYLHGLGGVGTLGAISKYYHGYRGGFTAEVPDGASWQIERRAEWWRTEVRKAGGDIWFGTLGCGVYMTGNRVRGVVVATPFGRGVVLAKTVIDSTGNADLAAAAGAACVYTDGTDIAVQGTGLPPRHLGASYTNTDFTITDETDMVDVTALFVYAKRKYPADAFDQGTLIDTRERRRIVGEAEVGVLDQVCGKTYSDVIMQARTNFDSHGYTVHPYLALQMLPKTRGMTTYMPYRALLPKDIRGLLVTGLGVSVHRDSLPLVRMQPDLQNQGYAAGVAAAMVRDKGGEPRDVDMKALQAHLVETGCLPETVAGMADGTPIPEAELVKATETIRDDLAGLPLLMSVPERAVPRLKKAYEREQDPAARLNYAKVLATLGDPAGLDVILEAIRRIPAWDDGWNYRAMGQFGANMSPLDTLVFAAGKTGSREVLPAILEKARLLDTSADFSHHRVIALALEQIADPGAAPVLAEVLGKPGMSGHALPDIAAAGTAHTEVDRSLTALEPRRRSLREIYLARALYRCGDRDGMARRILEAYTDDVRGHFARHARAVLSGTPPPAP